MGEQWFKSFPGFKALEQELQQDVYAKVVCNLRFERNMCSLVLFHLLHEHDYHVLMQDWIITPPLFTNNCFTTFAQPRSIFYTFAWKNQVFPEQQTAKDVRELLREIVHVGLLVNDPTMLSKTNFYGVSNENLLAHVMRACCMEPVENDIFVLDMFQDTLTVTNSLMTHILANHPRIPRYYLLHPEWLTKNQNLLQIGQKLLRYLVCHVGCVDTPTKIHVCFGKVQQTTPTTLQVLVVITAGGAMHKHMRDVPRTVVKRIPWKCLARSRDEDELVFCSPIGHYANPLHASSRPSCLVLFSYQRMLLQFVSHALSKPLLWYMAESVLECTKKDSTAVVQPRMMLSKSNETLHSFPLTDNVVVSNPGYVDKLLQFRGAVVFMPQGTGRKVFILALALNQVRAAKTACIIFVPNYLAVAAYTREITTHFNNLEESKDVRFRRGRRNTSLRPNTIYIWDIQRNKNLIGRSKRCRNVIIDDADGKTISACTWGHHSLSSSFVFQNIQFSENVVIVSTPMFRLANMSRRHCQEWYRYYAHTCAPLLRINVLEEYLNLFPNQRHTWDASMLRDCVAYCDVPSPSKDSTFVFLHNVATFDRQSEVYAHLDGWEELPNSSGQQDYTFLPLTLLEKVIAAENALEMSLENTLDDMNCDMRRAKMSNAVIENWLCTQNDDEMMLFVSKDNKEDDDTRCAVCYEEWLDPVQLPQCRHIFCARCVVRAFQASVSDASMPRCPLCRFMFLSPRPFAINHVVVTKRHKKKEAKKVSIFFIQNGKTQFCVENPLCSAKDTLVVSCMAHNLQVLLPKSEATICQAEEALAMQWNSFQAVVIAHFQWPEDEILLQLIYQRACVQEKPLHILQHAYGADEFIFERILSYNRFQIPHEFEHTLRCHIAINQPGMQLYAVMQVVLSILRFGRFEDYLCQKESERPFELIRPQPCLTYSSSSLFARFIRDAQKDNHVILNLVVSSTSQWTLDLEEKTVCLCDAAPGSILSFQTVLNNPRNLITSFSRFASSLEWEGIFTC